MRTTDLALRTLSRIFILGFAGCIPGHASLQTDQGLHTDQEKDKAASQKKEPEEKKPEPSTKGGIEILSDTMGVDFGPYMKRVRYAVKSHWNPLIPYVALPPLLKSGTVTIEFAIMKQGQVSGMKIVKSSGNADLDKAAWVGITSSLPLPNLPSEFQGDYLRLRCNFVYNPPAKQTPEAKQGTNLDSKK